MKKIYFWIMLLILGVFLVLLFWPNKKNKSEENNIKKNVVETYSPFYLPSVKEIEWKNKDFSEKKSEISKLSLKKINGDELRRIGGVLGYTNGYEKYLYWNEEMARIEFGRNVKKVTEIKVPNRISKEDMVTKFKKIINQINDDNDFEMEIKETRYVQFLFPWWISADINGANAISIEAVYKYKGKEVWGYWGYPIKAILKMDGELIKLEMYLPPKVEKIEKEISLVDSSLLKMISVDQNKIINIQGGEAYELAETDQTIEKAIVNTVNDIYVFDQKNLWLWPSYLINGEAEVALGRVNVKMINTEVTKK
ncbi:MAG TPA: hypothetical protein PK639_03895 [Candidatus Woesebacteria bacterium]|nr:hypothetical protein [Candidatus Woesebacteria bacterium]